MRIELWLELGFQFNVRVWVIFSCTVLLKCGEFKCEGEHMGIKVSIGLTLSIGFYLE